MRWPAILGQALRALTFALAGCVAACRLPTAESELPPPIPVSLSAAGELGRMTFQVDEKHGYFFALRLHFDPADRAARARLRELIDGTRPTSAGPTDLSIHLTLRRIDPAAGTPVFDDTVEALPQGFGGDWFERTIANRFVLEPGRYEGVVTLLKPRPAFAPYPATLTLTSDKGRVNYVH